MRTYTAVAHIMGIKHNHIAAGIHSRPNYPQRRPLRLQSYNIFYEYTKRDINSFTICILMMRLTEYIIIDCLKAASVCY